MEHCFLLSHLFDMLWNSESWSQCKDCSLQAQEARGGRIRIVQCLLECQPLLWDDLSPTASRAMLGAVHTIANRVVGYARDQLAVKPQNRNADCEMWISQKQQPPLGASVPTCIVNCNEKHLTPQRPAHPPIFVGHRLHSIHVRRLQWRRMGSGRRMHRSLAQPCPATCQVAAVRLFRTFSQLRLLKSPALPPQMGLVGGCQHSCLISGTAKGPGGDLLDRDGMWTPFLNSGRFCSQKCRLMPHGLKCAVQVQ